MGKKLYFSCVWRETDGHSTSTIKILSDDYIGKGNEAKRTHHF